jgi:hypothetical protein
MRVESNALFLGSLIAYGLANAPEQNAFITVRKAMKFEVNDKSVIKLIKPSYLDTSQ